MSDDRQMIQRDPMTVLRRGNGTVEAIVGDPSPIPALVERLRAFTAVADGDPSFVGGVFRSIEPMILEAATALEALEAKLAIANETIEKLKDVDEKMVHDLADSIAVIYEAKLSTARERLETEVRARHLLRHTDYGAMCRCGWQGPPWEHLAHVSECVEAAMEGLQ